MTTILDLVFRARMALGLDRGGIRFDGADRVVGQRKDVVLWWR